MLTAPDLDTLADYVGASAEEPALAEILDEAIEMVAERLGQSGLAKVPQHTYVLGIKLLGAELWQRRNSTAGVIQQFGDNGQVVRMSRDPWLACKAVLSRYVPIGSSG